MDKILNDLFSFQDIEYKNFNAKLIPTVDKDLIIGVRTPELRNYAKKLFKEDEKVYSKLDLEVYQFQISFHKKFL